jgi:phosphate-selective porin OprO/OprP
MRLTKRFVLAAVLAVVSIPMLGALSRPALAEDAAPVTPAQEKPATSEIVAKWNNGASVESADGSNVLQIGGLIQADGRFDVSDPTSTVVDTLLLRRVRPILQGRVDKYFEFRLMPDFAGGTLVLFDAYVDTKFSNAFRIRIGKDKTPIGLEQLQSDYALIFPERSLANNLVPNRDVGVQAQGTLAHGAVSYIGGVFNGIPDGTNGDTDANGGKDLVGRVTLKLGSLGVAVSGSTGSQSGALPSFKSNAQQTFFSYGSGVSAAGTRTRVSPSAFFYRGPFGAFAEYMRSSQMVAKGIVQGDVANTAWEVTAAVVATGERASDRGVTPARPFDPAHGQWGAFQVAARFSALTIDPQALALGFASPTASQSAKAVGVGVTWYANAHVKDVLTFERTVFDGGTTGPRRPENAIVFRVQLNLQPGL